ncbi:tRNA (N(6)-L-threonylcarbamoyladenosine(37)-C(2))-methylthiotransferase MtaB [Kordiimonas sp. SCSIO 12603]|uniref:tRNA (N(6)-L-threonylcarbamoyladenosine(37)-C(2))- methylthiotransferase MtaB n=1 Tax=Kordiimonas sp. SCSIO 12603 TaxID=2829596 RepID=UPI002102917C|nr:tRNA (N(6)-L-threonylcarbamoyladenosine(37)-C(2))-methylthiotransferase MtaB [Kordiimonas sp. SCSIO 12603]UTW59592.1 tRNA (N(6)-L-threonylcarbamoyladenosine(37)-C(2))-methylthiotransferase MtaB [Kordiimonas sp. SCSIO 12603]
MTNKADIVTFGCRLNAYESEVMQRHADAAGLDDVIIVNTCAVTAEATRQARQSIRRMKRERPDTPIIVTGCAAQINPDEFAKMDEVTTVLGNQEKLEAKSFTALATNELERVQVNDIFSVKETAGHLIDGFGERARAFVQIQNGCNHRCTFCIIPYGRGNSRSVAMGETVDQIKRLVQQGYNEVVLTGVDITSYGEDLPGNPTLGQLTQKILKLVPDLPRLRISSIDSIEVDEPLYDAIIGDDRLMPHLHLSLQAGDNMILKRMKRRHMREQAIEFCDRVSKARPDMVYGADIIAGFPTETEEMFENSLRLIEECDLTWLHVFPYSEREGTPAARIPNKVPKQIRKERAARLRAAGEMQTQKLFDRSVGRKAKLLLERVAEDGTAHGHTEQFIPVTTKTTAKAGEIIDVVLAKNDTRCMTTADKA